MFSERVADGERRGGGGEGVSDRCLFGCFLLLPRVDFFKFAGPGLHYVSQTFFWLVSNIIFLLDIS